MCRTWANLNTGWVFPGPGGTTQCAGSLGDVRSLQRGKGTGPCSHAVSPSEQALTVQAQEKRCNGNSKLQ